LEDGDRRVAFGALAPALDDDARGTALAGELQEVVAVEALALQGDEKAVGRQVPAVGADAGVGRTIALPCAGGAGGTHDLIVGETDTQLSLPAPSSPPRRRRSAFSLR